VGAGAAPPPNPPPRPASGSHRLLHTLGQVGEQYGPSIAPFARARCPFSPLLRPYVKSKSIMRPTRCLFLASHQPAVCCMTPPLTSASPGEPDTGRQTELPRSRCRPSRITPLLSQNILLIERHDAERGLFIPVVLAVVYTKRATATATRFIFGCLFYGFVGPELAFFTSPLRGLSQKVAALILYTFKCSAPAVPMRTSKPP
jgi:hypothetical protein